MESINGLERVVIGLYEKLGRPVHIGDVKSELGVLTKRDSTRVKHTRGDAINRGLLRLFRQERICKSEELARVEEYAASPYSTVRSSVTAQVRFYAPMECAGKELKFRINGSEYVLSFVDSNAEKARESSPTKTELVRSMLLDSERALSANEIVEKLGLYDTSTKQKFYNATTSITKAVLQKLMREGLRFVKCNGKYVWYFSEKQLQGYREYYVGNDIILKTVRTIVKAEKCVPINAVSSMLHVSPSDVRYRVEQDGNFVPAKILTKTTMKQTDVDLEVGNFSRDAFLPWLGYVVPKSDAGYGYETMLVDLGSNWQDELRGQVRKSLSRIHIRTLVGYFYEKLIAKLFHHVCTSRELQQDPELSRYVIPFVFRDERVVNVWTTLDSGRKAEFDVLIRGTFKAFDVMADGQSFLDLVIPMESKYTVITSEHVTHFDEKIRKVFGDNRNIIPIMIGLSWKNEAMTLARRFGFMTLYFSSVNKLVSALTGTEYDFHQEWKRVEDKLNSGELTLENLRRQMNGLELKYEFEELIEKRLNKKLETRIERQHKNGEPKTKVVEEKVEKGLVEPMLAIAVNNVNEILSQYPVVAWEYKLNGIRLIANGSDEGIRLHSRNTNDLTPKLPEVVEAISESIDTTDFILDGELVAVDESGKPLPPQFITKRINTDNPVANLRFNYVLFDILKLDSDNLAGYSYEERRRILESHIKQNGSVKIVHRMLSADKEEVEKFFSESKALGHEGLVAKSVDSPYKLGERKYWFKYKGEPDTFDAVVVGINWGKGWKKDTIGSILLAEKRDGKFHTIGKVGSGLKYYQSKKLHEALKPFITSEMPNEVVANDSPDLWVKPNVVVEVAYEGQTKSRKYTAGYSLKFPRFVRIREDKDV